MAVTSFIPEVWAARLLVALKEFTVLGQPGVINRDYEGEVANFGDTVHVNSLARPTIGDYTPNTTVIDPETLTTTGDQLLIDQNKYFAFEVDDVDAAQARDSGQLLTKAASESAQGLALAQDEVVTAAMTTDAGTTVPTDTLADGDAAYDMLRAFKVALDTNSVPMTGRWVAVDPEVYSLLLDNNKFVDASAYGSDRPIRNGEVGSALGFAVLLSNTLPDAVTGTWQIAGHGIATTVADQVSKVEAYRPDDSFSDAIKGLHVHGTLVVRPEALVVMDAGV